MGVSSLFFFLSRWWEMAIAGRSSKVQDWTCRRGGGIFAARSVGRFPTLLPLSCPNGADDREIAPGSTRRVGFRLDASCVIEEQYHKPSHCTALHHTGTRFHWRQHRNDRNRRISETPRRYTRQMTCPSQRRNPWPPLFTSVPRAMRGQRGSA